METIKTIKDIININTEINRDKIAFISEGRSYTFHQIYQRINGLIHALRGMGIKKGDHVGILAYNCSQYFEVFGLAKAGLVAVPLNYRSVGLELEYLINNSGITTLIFENEFISVIDSIRDKMTKVKNLICIDGEIPGIKNYENLVHEFTPEEPVDTVQPDDMAAIYYSSGTTGKPKGAVHTHKSLVAEMLLPQQFPELGLTPDDIVLCVMPFFHVGGSAAHMLPAFAMGCTSVILRKFDEKNILRAIQENKISYVCLVPAMIIRLMDYPDFGKYDLSSLKTIAYTGAPMPVEALKRAIKQFGPVFVQSLGQTETMKMTILPKADYKLDGSPKETKRLESAGKPPRPGEVRVKDKSGNDVKPGTPGEIACCSDRVMSAYWDMPEETAQTIKDGWLYSGDVGLMDKDGYVYLVDRKKDMIISGGENIYSIEVEDVLYKHPSVADAAVIGVPDEKWGESVKAILVLKEGMKASEKEIIEFCKERMASYKKPKSVEFCESVPKTATGKIKKAEIREKYWKGRNRRIN